VRRLSPAFLTMAMLGIVGLLVVAYIGKKLLAREAAPVVDNRISVPMALTDLEPGVRLTEAHLAMGPADRTKITRDTVLTNRVLIGRVVKNKITGAQPISTQDLYPPGERAPWKLEPGMVAVTMQVQPPFAAEKGQYVNVHFVPTADPDAEKTGGQIITLFRGVKVLDISSNSGMRSNLNVAFELTHEQSSIMLLAKDKGTLSFTYAPEGKGDGGVALSDEDRATLYEILHYTPTPEQKPEPPFRTDTFKGSRHGLNSFRGGLLIDDLYVNPNFQSNDNNTDPRYNRGNGAGSGNGNRGGNQQESGAGPSGPPSARLPQPPVL